MNIHRKTSIFIRLTAARRAAVAGCALAMLAGCGANPPVPDASGEEQYSVLAREVFAETNRLRDDPGAYVQVLKDIANRMDAGIYYPAGSRVGVVTHEGVVAVNEAIGVLASRRPLPTLQWSESLAELARAHVADTGARGLTGHASSTGSGFSARVSEVIGREGFSFSAENISYGYADGRDVVAQLVVDDGVPGRGHRKNMLREQLNYTGVGCGYHARYGHMCVALYAYGD
jgi:uncharacterized protein YkwD